MYLSASGEAISVVLVTERESKQSPVYFVSRALQGPEVNYPILEKLVLALIYAARRLRRYFQAHKIEVRTSQPLKQIMTKPETSGRLAKWAIKLGEQDIEYRQRVSIKGQALADFLLEVPETEGRQCNTITALGKESTTWTLHTNGAAGKEGCVPGLILQSPQGEEMTYALRFDFQTSNNEAEYEALLAGLRLATKNGVKDIKILSDSMLVTNQVNEVYEARDPRMKRYVETVNSMAKLFDTLAIKQIPRSENRRADALSKLASTSFDHLTKKVLVEVLKERSIDETQVKEISSEGAAWMTPIVDYIKHVILPEDETQARKIRIKAPQYSIMEGRLYKKGYLVPWLKCITSQEGQQILQETHSGDVGAHEGARALTRKILLMGVYWPEIQCDVAELTKKCVACQTFAPVQNLPTAQLTSLAGPWPFHQ
ncbi:hypothetical protein L2E82_30973 [Cichorium intybus]|uniref:Uncharacterized protein n=1 Tax=Cichorium intybus TaxID=13427 RepID=A0ACB9D1P0_CICIN|nr:hypothetical protein L2E82_30973 [Cichorium intybus]